MSQYWTITDIATGAVIHAGFLTGSKDVHPKDAGFDWNATKHAATRITAAPSTEAQSWNGAAWVDDPGKVEAELLASIDRQRERMQMLVLTDGGAKKYVYSRKAEEVVSARGVLAATLNALGIGDKKKRFPFAYAESLVTGEALTVVLARFEEGMNASASEGARVEALAQKAKRDVRAATTAAQKTQVYSAIKWATPAV